jgi:hypothetical protein
MGGKKKGARRPMHFYSRHGGIGGKGEGGRAVTTHRKGGGARHDVAGGGGGPGPNRQAAAAGSGPAAALTGSACDCLNRGHMEADRWALP